MTAGLLSYRLCDREYDCDGCSLDAALRGGGEAAGRRSLGGHRDAAWCAAAARAAEADGDGGLPGAANRPAGSQRGAEATAAGAGDRPGPDGRPLSAHPRGELPDDRLYAPGHTWLRPCGAGGNDRFRFGLDAFAAALLEPPRAVRCAAAGRRLLAGETASELDLDGGVLALALPVAGEVVAANAACRRDPSLLVADPYGHGWLLEIAATPDGTAPRPGGAPAALPAPAATPGPDLTAAAASPADAAAPVPPLFPAAEARRRAVHDLRRFRRRVALDLLAADQSLGTTLPDGGEPLLDLRALLGARRHLELVRELVR
jgi:glycine cleavage system H protein